MFALFVWWTITEPARVIETEAKRTATEAKAEARDIERAAQPAKIYDVELLPNGNYRVKEYQPYRVAK